MIIEKSFGIICSGLFVAALFVGGMSMAAFSAFVVITPANEGEHAFNVLVEPVDDRADRFLVRVSGPLDGYQKAWLVMCRRSLLASGQNFRSMIWYQELGDKDVVELRQLTPSTEPMRKSADDPYPFVELVLSKDEMKRSYIYIDFPREVRDGGYYYSIDLAHYLPDDSGKRIFLQWEKQ